MITIIDYGTGNLKSIRNGFLKIGKEAKITNNINEIEKAEFLVLPGVGAFGLAMKNIKKFETVIIDHINEDKPFLGVCLGLQLLFTKSQESKGIKGLDVFPGEVVLLPTGMKIPHMGWNNLNIRGNCPLLKDIGNDYVYFVHSYHVKPEDDNIIAATVDYGVEITAAVCKDNIFATQFHPEKSGETGLKILKNFTKYNR